jgi:hypothetical protein
MEPARRARLARAKGSKPRGDALPPVQMKSKTKSSSEHKVRLVPLKPTHTSKKPLEESKKTKRLERRVAGNGLAKSFENENKVLKWQPQTFRQRRKFKKTMKK